MSDIDLDTYMPNARVLLADGSGNITGVVTRAYNFRFSTDVSAEEVIAEPS
jgi:hypothetical protein